MTGTLPSWSPLNDPQLSAQIETGLQKEREFERQLAQRDLYFLERFAWQEYPVKCGRWRVRDASSALTADTNIAGPWTKKEWSPDSRWVMLLDPSTRQPIAAHYVNWWHEERPGDKHSFLPVGRDTTSIWFAGDPRACGMFTPAGNGHRAAFGYRVGKSDLKSWVEGPARFEKATALLAAEPYTEPKSPEYGPWIADSPQPPRRPARFGRAAWSSTVPTEP